MKKETLILIKDFITTQLNYWPLFTIVVTLLGITGHEKPVLWIWGLCSLLPFFFFLSRRYTNAFWIFAASHLLGAAVLFFLPCSNMEEKILLLVFAAVELIYSFYLHLGTEDRLDQILNPCITIGIIAAALGLQSYAGQQGWDIYYISIAIGYLGCFFLEHYIENYLYFLYTNDSSNGNIPEQAILRYGIRATVLYSLAGVLILLATANINWLAGIMQQIKTALIWILRFLFRNVSGEEPVPEEIPEQEIVQNLPEGMGEPAKTFIIWEILEKVLQAAFFLAFAALLIWLLWNLVRFLLDRFGRRATMQVINLKNGTDIREKCQIEKQRKAERKTLFSFWAPEERIRKIYRRQVLAGKEQLIGDLPQERLEYLTAGECGEGLDQHVLAEVYEKARYSQEECTAEDVRKIRKK